MNLMPHNHLMWANIGICTGRLRSQDIDVPQALPDIRTLVSGICRLAQIKSPARWPGDL
jgi:hypothetical protein